MKLNGKNIYLSFLKGKSFEPKGEFDATAIYQNTSQIIDCVFYNGNTYYCKKTTTAGILPTNTEYWGVLLSNGVEIDSELSSASLNPVQNKVVAQELGKKQDKLTAENAGYGINIKDNVISTPTSEESQVLLYSGGATSGTITLGNISSYKFLIFISADGNNCKTYNIVNTSAFTGVIGLYGYASNYINIINISGELTNKSFSIGAVSNQKLLAVWGIK